MHTNELMDAVHEVFNLGTITITEKDIDESFFNGSSLKSGLSAGSQFSGIISIALGITGQTNPYGILFGGIAVALKGLEISLYSPEPAQDTVKEGAKIGLSGLMKCDEIDIFIDPALDFYSGLFKK